MRKVKINYHKTILDFGDKSKRIYEFRYAQSAGLWQEQVC